MKSEVLRILGEPNYTKTTGFGEYWEYNKVTYDPINDRVDTSTVIWFNDLGRVRKVSSG